MTIIKKTGHKTPFISDFKSLYLRKRKIKLNFSHKKNLNKFYSDLTYIMDIQTSKNEMTVNENIRFWIKLFSSNIKLKQLDGIFDLLSLDKYKTLKLIFYQKEKLEK